MICYHVIYIGDGYNIFEKRYVGYLRIGWSSEATHTPQPRHQHQQRLFYQSLTQFTFITAVHFPHPHKINQRYCEEISLTLQ